MRTISLLIITLFGTQLILGQSISGKVISGISQQPIPYATIILKTLENQFLEGTTTLENGTFTLAYEAGDYILEASFIGFKTYSSSIIIENNEELTIILEEEETALEEVVVTAEQTTVLQLIDKKVINVGKDLLASGGNATTILSQLSEVQTDRDGNISLRGSNNVSVLVNGKPSPLENNELLQQINADEIIKVEIITSPSAKYQADGLTGIINILTKSKIQKGVNFSTNLNGNTLGGYGTRINLNYGGEKISYKIGGSYTKNISKYEFTQDRNDILPFRQENDLVFNGDVYNFNGTIDWFPNDNNEFSIGLDFTDNSHTLDNDAIIFLNGENTTQNTLGDHIHRTLKINGNYRYKFNEEDYLELDAQISNNTNVLASDFLPNLGVLDNSTDNDVIIYNTAIDLSTNLSESTKLETGLLWNRQNLDNSRVFIENNTPLPQENFENTQSTYAIYASLQHNLPKLNIQIGLRGEHFEREAYLEAIDFSIQNNFTNLFPSVHLKYNWNEENTATFGFNRRTSRPTLIQINPITFQPNEFTLNQGNPSLNPEFSNNFDVSYRFEKKNFSFSPTLSYRLKEDAITYNYFLNDAGVNVYDLINNGKADSYGLELLTTFKPLVWWDGSIGFNWNYEKLRIDQLGLGINFSRSTSLVFRNQLTLSKKTNAVISWRYYGPRDYYFLAESNYSSFDLGFRHKLFDGKGNLNLRITDIFSNLGSTSSNTGIGFVQNDSYNPQSTIAYLTFTYTLSGGTVKERSKKARQYNSGIIE